MKKKNPKIRLFVKKIKQHKLLYSAFSLVFIYIVYPLVRDGIKFLFFTYFTYGSRYYEYAIDHKPKFEFTNVSIDSVILSMDSLWVKDFITERRKMFPSSHFFPIPNVVLKFNVKFTVVNTSPIRGIYIAHAAYGAFGDDVNIRDSMKANRMGQELINFTSDSELDQNDPLTLDFPVICRNSESIIINLIIIYKNELGQLFDTYYWYLFKKPKEPIVVFKGGFNGSFPAGYLQKRINDFSYVPLKSPEYYVYSYEETENIYRYMNSWDEFFKKFMNGLKKNDHK